MKNILDTVHGHILLPEEYFRDTYEGFLTEEEMDLCINLDKQMWMKADEIIERLERRQKYFQELDGGITAEESTEISLNKNSEIEFPVLANIESKENIQEPPKRKSRSKIK